MPVPVPLCPVTDVETAKMARVVRKVRGAIGMAAASVAGEVLWESDNVESRLRRDERRGYKKKVKRFCQRLNKTVRKVGICRRKHTYLLQIWVATGGTKKEGKVTLVEAEGERESIL